MLDQMLLKTDRIASRIHEFLKDPMWYKEERRENFNWSGIIR